MRLVFRIGIYFFYSLLLLLPAFSHAAINTSPIVQLVSYENIFGLHVERIGWGSASLINDQGIIISNNHVVEDSQGNSASAFSVCITKEIGQRPVCDYTAHLIARDASMDISILRIDPIDVHGQPVPYQDFQYIPVDFSYTPTVRDELVIIGYPWVGANTLTETKGIVGGTTEYNEHTYIKTDAIIAGGNSGGAMISAEGKLVGIPTFTMGGMIDSSLGYGLLIKEAQAFIETHQDTIPQNTEQQTTFASIQKLLDSINTTRTVEDPYVQIRFSTTYGIHNYVPKQYIELRSISQKDTAVQALSLSILPALPTKDTKEFHRYLEALEVYDSTYERLEETTIGNKVFYYPVNKSDPSNGAYNTYTSYYAPTPTGMIQIEVLAPLDTENTTLQSQTRQEVANVLKGITFTEELNSAVFPESLSLRDPFVEIQGTGTVLSFQRLGKYIQFFDSLQERSVFSVTKKDSYTGKGQTAEELFRTTTTEIPQNMKALIEVQGVRGFIACSDTSYLAIDGFTTFDYPFYTIETNLDGSPLPETRVCAIRLVEGLVNTNNDEYTLDVVIHAPAAQVTDVLEKTFTILKKQTNFNTEGTTSLINPTSSRVHASFEDLDNQQESFRNALSVLVNYGIIDNNKHFRPYQPLRWNGFLPLYLRMVYGIDSTTTTPCSAVDISCQLVHTKIQGVEREVAVSEIITAMNIDLNAYVPLDQLYAFHKFFQLYLAGVPLGNMTERDLTIITSLDRAPDGSTVIPSERLRTLSYILYEGNALSYNQVYESTSFISFHQFLHHPRIGLIEKEMYFDNPTDFNGISPYFYRPFAEGQEDRAKRRQQAYQTLQECSATFACLQEYLLTTAQILQEEQEAAHTYVVLNKGKAFDFLLDNMHLGFFDPTLLDR